MVASFGGIEAGKKPPLDAPRPDFGWRLYGKPIRVLHDSSLTLLPTWQRATAALIARYCGDAKAFESCLQCGACTVNCHLAQNDGSLFPRRQMTLLQLGEVEKLVADPRVWLCFNCKDCTSRCPAEAGPGRVMAAIRRIAVERFSVPRLWSRLANQPQGFLYTLLAAGLLLLMAIAIGGSFSPSLTSVGYASMLPHLTLNIFFGALTALVIATAMIGAAQAWRAFTGEALWHAELKRVIKSLGPVVRQIAKHEQFAECQEFPLSRWAHLSLFYGFLVLLVLAGAAAVLIAVGAPYPLAALHPLKLAGNLAAGLITFGSLYFCVERRRTSRRRGENSWFDWALPMGLLLVSVTGVLAEVFRYVNVPALAYPTYFLHLVFVFALFASAANSKFAHAFYRTVALTAEQYKRKPALQFVEVVGRRMIA